VSSIGRSVDAYDRNALNLVIRTKTNQISFHVRRNIKDFSGCRRSQSLRKLREPNDVYPEMHSKKLDKSQLQQEMDSKKVYTGEVDQETRSRKFNKSKVYREMTCQPSLVLGNIDHLDSFRLSSPRPRRLLRKSGRLNLMRRRKVTELPRLHLCPNLDSTLRVITVTIIIKLL
jgi:hypothetical protein